MRLIDADALKKMRFSCGMRDDDYVVYAPIREVMENIDKAPTIGGWIKCTPDTMPETNDEVLTTYIVNGDKKRRFVEAASWFYDGEEGHWNSAWDEYRVAGTRIEVLAWMPMPEPYMD